MISVDYAATFWAKHLEGAQRTIPMQNALVKQSVIHTFLCSKFLEWLECLSLLENLQHAIEALEILEDRADVEDNVSLSMLVQHAKNFFFQHYRTIEVSPLQIYNSALAFSPETSIIRKINLDKLPVWLRKLSQMEDSWASSRKIFTDPSNSFEAIAFSPDCKQIASGSIDKTIKLWDVMTGNLLKTFIGHSNLITTIVFSPDSKKIESAYHDKNIKLWNDITGNLQRTLIGHSDSITAVAFSPDGKKIASGSWDKNIKLWDIVEALKVSRIFGSRVGRRIDFRKWQEIETSEVVKSLRFSIDGRHFITNLGLIEIENTIDTQSPDYQSLQLLSASYGWIYYGAIPIVRIPSYLIDKSPQPTSKGHISPNWNSHESSPESASFKPARECGYIATEALNEEHSHRPSEFAHSTNSYYSQLSKLQIS
ncbi:hypothetical protein BOTCAL_2080g00010 [Botryotinia calthae]|uniref:Uncharacterized protein n=1 Tax=Botryotinia calthae TaxID=38488 RepID=A0A4Y8CC37_9HELO|nr:hypothetical protein BOTCAL_2080g00010 [Botryotinia calthae]